MYAALGRELHHGEGCDIQLMVEAKVFEIINFNPQVIADLIVEFPSCEDRVNAMMDRYRASRSQALLTLLLPFQDSPLYFDKEEYHRQMERLKILRQILQEVRDVKDE